MSLTRERDGFDLDTPEHDKLMAVPRDQREAVQEFFDWLNDQGWTICELVPTNIYGDHEFRPITIPPQRIMAQFYGVDYQAFDREKAAMLDGIRAWHAEKEKSNEQPQEPGTGSGANAGPPVADFHGTGDAQRGAGD